jgi:hypothetical protein
MGDCDILRLKPGAGDPNLFLDTHFSITVSEAKKKIEEVLLVLKARVS